MSETVIGKHLLGRIPSPPDDRDYQLREFLGSDATILANAIDELKQTKTGFINPYWKVPPAATHWGKALALLASLTPTPPPSPTGDVVYQNSEPVLDQGNYGTCVGNGWAQWGNTNPVDDKFTEKEARAIYYEATVIDGQPDDPDSSGGGQQGSTVRSGAKAMQNRKRNSVYAFAASLDEIKQWLQSGKGVVVIGSDWTNDMFNPDSKGYVVPTGGVAGGHCYILVGDLESEGAFLFENSWGSGWGQKGYFKMKYADFQKLFDSQGEACVAVELA